MEEVKALAAFAAALAGALWYLFRWRRTKKTWCVIFYHLSRDTNADFVWPDETGLPQQDALDEKLDQVVHEIESLPSSSLLTAVKTAILGTHSSPDGVDWDDVHIVYRAVWNDHPIRPDNRPVSRAKVVSWRLGAPSVPDDQSLEKPTAVPPLDDKNGFFTWAYENCPAHHYAVFFWGHSIGPGGLFELSKSATFSALPATVGWALPGDLIEVRDTLKALYDKRLKDPSGFSQALSVQAGNAGVPAGGSTPASAASGGGPGPTTPATPQPPTPLPPKTEIVLFQSCWMSTLETAFELKDVARYVVASQSLVPIGYQYDQDRAYAGPLGPVWPYQRMIATLLAKPDQFADAVLGDLQQFFDTDQANRLPSPLVTFTLLDLGPNVGTANEVAVNVTPLLKALIAELAALRKEERLFLTWGNWITQFRNDDPNDDLEAGEWALVDVIKLCRALATPATYLPFNPPNASQIVHAASRVLAALGPQPTSSSQYALVRNVFESPTGPGAAPLGFNGISVLWIPGPDTQMPLGDPYIAAQIDGTFYRRLAFVTDTAVSGQPSARWDLYAFEQAT